LIFIIAGFVLSSLWVRIFYYYIF